MTQPRKPRAQTSREGAPRLETPESPKAPPEETPRDEEAPLETPESPRDETTFMEFAADTVAAPSPPSGGLTHTTNVTPSEQALLRAQHNL